LGALCRAPGSKRACAIVRLTSLDLKPMNLQLENKLALVSGSTAGIGLAIAKALAAEGARVIVNGRTETRVKEAIASIRANVPTAKLERLALDLAKADAAAQTTKRYPDLNILVNNLGVYTVRHFEQ